MKDRDSGQMPAFWEQGGKIYTPPLEILKLHGWVGDESTGYSVDQSIDPIRTETLEEAKRRTPEIAPPFPQSRRYSE